MTNPFDFRKGSRKRNKESPGWKQQEKRLARDFKGKVTPGSGNQDHSKGDVKMELALLEAKSTEKNSISLKKEWLEKIDDEAVGEGLRIPALGITFTNVKPGTEKDWIILPKWAVQLMMNHYKDQE